MGCRCRHGARTELGATTALLGTLAPACPHTELAVDRARLLRARQHVMAPRARATLLCCTALSGAGTAVRLQEGLFDPLAL